MTRGQRVLFFVLLAALALVTALIWSEPAGSGCPWDPDCAEPFEGEP